MLDLEIRQSKHSLSVFTQKKKKLSLNASPLSQIGLKILNQNVKFYKMSWDMVTGTTAHNV